MFPTNLYLGFPILTQFYSFLTNFTHFPPLDSSN